MNSKSLDKNITRLVHITTYISRDWFNTVAQKNDEGLRRGAAGIAVCMSWFNSCGKPCNVAGSTRENIARFVAKASDAVTAFRTAALTSVSEYATDAQYAELCGQLVRINRNFVSRLMDDAFLECDNINGVATGIHDVVRARHSTSSTPFEDVGWQLVESLLLAYISLLATNMLPTVSGKAFEGLTSAINWIYSWCGWRAY